MQSEACKQVVAYSEPPKHGQAGKVMTDLNLLDLGRYEPRFPMAGILDVENPSLQQQRCKPVPRTGLHDFRFS